MLICILVQRYIGPPRWLSSKRISLIMQERLVRSLCQEIPLEEEMATHFSILAWKIPWTEETGGLESTGLQKLDTTK